MLQDDYRGNRGMDRAWLITMLMFVGGYVLALWGILACMKRGLEYPRWSVSGVWGVATFGRFPLAADAEGLCLD